VLVSVSHSTLFNFLQLSLPDGSLAMNLNNLGRLGLSLSLALCGSVQKALFLVGLPSDSFFLTAIHQNSVESVLITAIRLMELDERITHCIFLNLTASVSVRQNALTKIHGPLNSKVFLDLSTLSSFLLQVLQLLDSTIQGVVHLSSLWVVDRLTVFGFARQLSQTGLHVFDLKAVESNRARITKHFILGLRRKLAFGGLEPVLLHLLVEHLTLGVKFTNELEHLFLLFIVSIFQLRHIFAEFLYRSNIFILISVDEASFI